MHEPLLFGCLVCLRRQMSLDSRFRGNDKIRGVQRGKAPLAGSPRLGFLGVSKEGAGIRPCRGSGGVPQLLLLPPRMGARGLKMVGE